MGILSKVNKSKKPKELQRLMNWYGPYLGAGVKIEYIADDWREVRVVII